MRFLFDACLIGVSSVSIWLLPPFRVHRPSRTGLGAVLTFEYMRLSGRLMAIDSSHTNMIFNITLLRVLFRPNFIGYLRLRYRSTLMVHRCIMLAVQNSTSRHIHARQYTGANGNSPGKKKKRRSLYRVRPLNETTRPDAYVGRLFSTAIGVSGKRNVSEKHTVSNEIEFGWRLNKLYFENKNATIRTALLIGIPVPELSPPEQKWDANAIFFWF